MLSPSSTIAHLEMTTLLSGPGDDLAFGGAFEDEIDGGEGQDIILGDFGQYNVLKEFLPNHYYESILDFADFAGSDLLKGGDGDDVLMGQEGNDTIYGQGSSDTAGTTSIVEKMSEM